MTIRVLVPVPADAAERTHSALKKRLESARIDAVTQVVLEPEIEDVVEYSRDAALVYLPLRIAGMQLTDAFGWGISRVLERLPIVALVAAAEDVQLSEE